MSQGLQEWMVGTWDGKTYYDPAEWMKGTWNGDFFYELSKLGDFACFKFCIYNGLVSKRFECPICGDDMKWSELKRWKCRKSAPIKHNIQRSLRKGSFFEGSKMSLGLILRFTYMWVNKIPQESIINDLGIASQTAMEWKNYCKEVCMDYCLRFSGTVGGEGMTVDIYDAWLSEKKNRIERRVKGNSVFVGLVRNLNDFFVEVVEERSAEVLIDVIIKRVVPGSTVVLSCGTMYNDYRMQFEQLEFLHNVKVTNTSKTTDGTWLKVRKGLQGSEFTDGEFNYDLAEYIWRRGNNHVITQKVKNFFQTISESYPPKTKEEVSEDMEISALSAE